MKKITVLIVTLVLASAVFANAQTDSGTTTSTPAPASSGGGGGETDTVGSPPEALLMITNIGVLKDYAEKQVTQGSIGVYSEFALDGGNRNFNTGNVPTGGIEAVLLELRSWQPDFNVTEVTNGVSVFGYMADESGHGYFYLSETDGLVLYPDGRYWFNTNYGGSVFRIAPVVPIKLPGIRHARVIIKDSRGGVQYIRDLPLGDDGYLYYPTNLVGRIGELALSFYNGQGLTGVAYNLGTGAQLPVKRVYGGGFSLTVDNDFEFGWDPTDVRLIGIKDIRSALVSFTISPGSNKLVGFGGYDQAERIPIGILLRDFNGPLVYQYIPLVRGITGGATTLSISPGRWRVIYIVTPEDLSGVPFEDTPGGKG